MMRIAIEAQRIFRPNKHGMDFVALEVIRELQKMDKENEYFVIVNPDSDRCLEESENVHIIELKCPTYPLWEQIALPHYIKKLRPDLLHCTSNTAPLHCSVPLVVTLHDIIYLEKRQSTSKSLYQEMGWHYRRLVVPRILPKCNKIITVSNFEKERIGQSLNIPKDKLLAIYNGYSPHFQVLSKDKTTIRKYIEQDPYIFFLGNTDPKKNTPRVLRAYDIYLQRSEERLPMLIADLDEAFIDKILENENLTSIKKRLRFPGYIANSDLPALYNAASVFLYPSLRESFGIPMLEAMACGTPLIAGNTSAMPEIAGEGALLVNPFSENDIAEKLLALEKDPKLHQKQVNYGLERVKQFSWKHSAEALLKVYKQVVEENK